MWLLYKYGTKNKTVVSRIMNLALMKFSLLPCGLKHIPFIYLLILFIYLFSCLVWKHCRTRVQRYTNKILSFFPHYLWASSSSDENCITVFQWSFFHFACHFTSILEFDFFSYDVGSLSRFFYDFQGNPEVVLH